MAKTAMNPDELAEFRKRINDGTYLTDGHIRIMVAVLNALADAIRQRAPEPPAPSDKAERIRECIKRIHAASENALIAHQRDGAHDWVIFRSDVWELIAVLEQDDPDV